MFGTNKDTAGVSCRIVYHVHLVQQSNKMPVGKTRNQRWIEILCTRVLSSFNLTAALFNNLFYHLNIKHNWVGRILNIVLVLIESTITVYSHI